jgi:hypothetical protein
MGIGNTKEAPDPIPQRHRYATPQDLHAISNPGITNIVVLRRLGARHQGHHDLNLLRRYFRYHDPGLDGRDISVHHRIDSSRRVRRKKATYVARSCKVSDLWEVRWHDGGGDGTGWGLLEPKRLGREALRAGNVLGERV